MYLRRTGKQVNFDSIFLIMNKNNCLFREVLSQDDINKFQTIINAESEEGKKRYKKEFKYKEIK